MLIHVGNSTVAATAPTGSNTVVLLNTFLRLGREGSADVNAIERYKAVITHDQAFTLRLSWADTDGVFTGNVFESRAIAAPTSPETADLIDVPVGGMYLLVEAVNGGVTQGTWKLYQSLVTGDRSSST